MNGHPAEFILDDFQAKGRNSRRTRGQMAPYAGGRFMALSFEWHSRKAASKREQYEYEENIT